MCVVLHMSVITQDGVSALMAAASEGKTEAVVELVKAGAKVDMQTEVCQYIYVVHDVNVQNHTSRLNSLLFVTHYNNLHIHCTCMYMYLQCTCTLCMNVVHV